jgi:endo-1,4-beta-xylanase
LLLNDYNNIEWSGDNTHYLSIISRIKTAGAPIDAIGAQGHDLDNRRLGARPCGRC